MKDADGKRVEIDKDFRKQYVGINLERDFEICSLYIDGLLPHVIAELMDEEMKERRFGIAERRIQAIVYENAAYVNPKVAWSKARRVHLRQHLIVRKIKNAKDESSKKDIVEQLDSLQKEVEGEKSLVDNSTHYHQITLVTPEERVSENRVSSLSI